MAMKKKKGNKSLSKRYQTSYASKDQGGGGNGIFKWRELEHDVKFYQPPTGRGRINIIPYTIQTKNHPLVKKGEFEIGDMDYVMDIWSHRMVGPSGSSVLCLKKTFGKPCPICEQAESLKKNGKEKEAGELKASRRCFYNIEDLKKPGELMVFEVSHFLFEKELIDEARGEDNDEGFIEFADPEHGKEIKFRVQKISRGGFEFNEFKSFSFQERDEPIDEDLLAQAISFDAIMPIPSYDDVQKILFGADEDEEDEAPPKKKPTKTGGGGKCPFGHRFGADCDKNDDCDDCDKWSDCVNAS